MFQQITTNRIGKHTRYEELNGHQFLVAPMVMMTEGVHSGSNGPLYYPAGELAKTPVAWNMKPVVVYHPQFGTATTPTELDARMVGMVMNTRWDGKRLKAEAWLDPNRLERIAPEVNEALQKNQTVEVSTGLFTDNVPDPGTWNGEDYEYIATNYSPDHLALLPTGKGACSVTDGCGLLQLNQEPDEMTENQETGLPLPTMNFEKPSCGCGKTDPACGGEVAAVVAPQPWPVQSHEQPNYNATDGNQGGETPLPLPSTL